MGRWTIVQCSRILTHIPDISKAINEMVRVVRSGGCDVFSEGNFYSHVVYTSDERLRSIASAKNQHTIYQCANPGAAMDSNKLLVVRSDMENVKMWRSSPSPCSSLILLIVWGLPIWNRRWRLRSPNKLSQLETWTISWRDCMRLKKAGVIFVADVMFEVSFDKIN
jgi:hypothetical protein